MAVVVGFVLHDTGRRSAAGRGKEGEEGVYLSSRNFLSAHEKVMKFLERQRERERDSGGV